MKVNVNKVIGNTFLWVWIVAWFSCIWIPQYEYELFFTGLFAIFLGFIFVLSSKEAEKREKKENEQKEKREKCKVD